MSEKMTPRERLVAAFTRQEADRPAVMPAMMRWIRGHAGCTCEMHQLDVCEQFGFDPMVMYGMYLNRPLSAEYVYRPDEGTYRDLPGVTVDIRVENHADHTLHIRTFQTPDGVLTDRITWARPDVGYGDGPNPHREEPLVKSIEDIPALKHLYPCPRKDVLGDMLLFTEMVGQRAVVEYYESSNAGAWGMEQLGPENMLLCAVENQQLLQAVLRVSQDQHLRNLRAVLEAGHQQIVVSWFQCGPSVGWSPDNFNEFFLPLVRESVELVHNYGGCYRYQDDGRMADLLGLLIDLGVDVISGLQPPPIGDCLFGKIRKDWGQKVCLMGGLDPVYTFERGSAATVRAAVEELLDEAGDAPGLIVGTAEAFGPETPAECLQSLAECVRGHGR